MTELGYVHLSMLLMLYLKKLFDSRNNDCILCC